MKRVGRYRPPPLVDYGSYPEVKPVTELRSIKGPLRRAKQTMFGELLRRQKRWLWLFAAVIMASAGGGIAAASTIQALVDKGIVEQSAPISVLFRNAAIAAAFVALLAFARIRLGARLIYQLDFDLRTWLFTRLQSADIRRLDTLTSGQVISRAFTDVRLVESAMQGLPLGAAALPAILALAVFVFIQSPLMGILAVAALPINLGLVALFRHPLRALSWAELNERAEVAAAIDEPVRGIRVVQAFDRAPDERHRVGAVALRVFRLALGRVRLLARYDFFLKLVPLLVNAVVLGVGVTLAADGRLTLGTMLLAFNLINTCSLFAQAFDSFASIWQYLTAAQSRLTELLLLGGPPVQASAALVDETGIELRGVSVRLGGRQVLDNLDLDVAPGELVVLRGSPGSGKTTLASVAAGMLQPDDGQVVVGGADVRLLGVIGLRQAVLVASEVPFLFAGTLRENLELASDDAETDDDLLQALRAAGAADVVDALPGGLDGTVGDRGLTLSGGQRQRVALARALIHPPRVLVLDDALSAVNPSRELEILQRVRERAPRTAILCITRRRGPTTIADRVVELPDPDLDVAASASALGESAMVDAGEGTLAPRHLKFLRDLKLGDETPEYPENEAPTSGSLPFATITQPYRRMIAIAFLALACLTAARLFPNFVIGDAANIIDADDATRQGWIRASLLVVAGFAVGGSSWWFRVAVQRYGQSVMYLLRRRIFHRLSSLGIDYFDRELPGTVAARVVYDLDTIADFIQQTAFTALVLVAQVLLALVAMSVIDIAVVPVVLGGLVVLALICVVLIPRIARAIEVQRQRISEVSSSFEEDFLGRRDVRLYGAGDKRNRTFATTAWRLRGAQAHVANLASSYAALIEFAAALLSVSVLAVAGNRVLSLQVTVGAALTLNLLSQNTVNQLGNVGSIYALWLRTKVSWRELGQPFREPILPLLAPDPQPVGAVKGEIQFDAVDFAYPHTREQVLHGVDFLLQAGDAVALVGYTGAGKSSIAKLLIRMYDPQAGRVLVDGHDLRDLDLSEYRRQIGVVPQDAFLFKGTIHSNIAYGRADAARDDVEAAAREVGAYEVLASLEQGFETEVQEEGRNLTGAQQQLVALARAWLARPRIMVLDEATSALDAALERSVLDAVTRLGCTTLMVTHRESVVAVADRIVVLDAGQVVEDGVPADVVGAGGPYDRLWVAEVGTGARSPRRRASRKAAPDTSPRKTVATKATRKAVAKKTATTKAVAKRSPRR